MKTTTILITLVILLALSTSAAFLFIPHSVEIRECNNITDYKIVYVEKQCIQDMVSTYITKPNAVNNTEAQELWEIKKVENNLNLYKNYPSECARLHNKSLC